MKLLRNKWTTKILPFIIFKIPSSNSLKPNIKLLKRKKTIQNPKLSKSWRWTHHCIHNFQKIKKILRRRKFLKPSNILMIKFNKKWTSFCKGFKCSTTMQFPLVKGSKQFRRKFLLTLRTSIKICKTFMRQKICLKRQVRMWVSLIASWMW